MQGEKRTNIIDVLIEAMLIAFICLPPLALGSVSPWAQGALFFAALCLMALWLIQCAWMGRLRIARTFGWVFLLVFVVVVVAQLLPLSPPALRALSPGSAAAYARTLPDYAGGCASRSISLHPYATGAALARMLMLGMVFFVLVNSVRSRWQVMGLVLALVAVGGFEALYGLGEQFSGHRHIFWMPRQFHLAGPTGTFHNKNHFAGLLLMIIPVVFGLVFAGFRPRSRREALRSPTMPAGVRLSRALSSPTFYRHAVLMALATLMILAVIFSLSRAGTFCMATALVALLACLGMAAGLRRYTIVMFLIVAAIVGVSFGIGMELVISRAEDLISGESVSWPGRLDMWRSGLRWWRDFPLLGSGLGTCRAVILRYQSARFGDRVADFVHNDWLQIFCEMGVAGGLLLILGCWWFLMRAARAAQRRRRTLARWVTAGAVIGAGAMLMHSFFDYNLGKITSNAVIFVILLGLAYATAHLPSDGDEKTTGRGYWTLNLRYWPARTILVFIAGAVVAVGWWVPCVSIGADIHFNRYLARSAQPWLEPDAYFFLKTSREPVSEGPSDLLTRARELDRHNPRYVHAAAQDLLAQADALAERRARDSARTILGEESEAGDPRGFEDVVMALKRSLRATMADERRDF
ncbi:MAG: O-antigen ligase family protein, partial [Bradyrhizobium sp.]|nr:O-antigen ligase family protein [Bradyrhizobium sp.]